jgi:hypothetical protein
VKDGSFALLHWLDSEVHVDDVVDFGWYATLVVPEENAD